MQAEFCTDIGYKHIYELCMKQNFTCGDGAKILDCMWKLNISGICNNEN